MYHIFIVALCVVLVSCIVFYDRKRKIIVKDGACRANGHGSSKITSHAEEIAIKYCRQFDRKNKYDIYLSGSKILYIKEFLIHRVLES